MLVFQDTLPATDSSFDDDRDALKSNPDRWAKVRVADTKAGATAFATEFCKGQPFRSEIVGLEVWVCCPTKGEPVPTPTPSDMTRGD